MIGNVSLSINLDVLSIVNVVAVHLFIVYIVLAVNLLISHVLCQKCCLMMNIYLCCYLFSLCFMLIYSTCICYYCFVLLTIFPKFQFSLIEKAFHCNFLYYILLVFFCLSLFSFSTLNAILPCFCPFPFVFSCLNFLYVEHNTSLSLDEYNSNIFTYSTAPVFSLFNFIKHSSQYALFFCG